MWPACCLSWAVLRNDEYDIVSSLLRPDFAFSVVSGAVSWCLFYFFTITHVLVSDTIKSKHFFHFLPAADRLVCCECFSGLHDTALCQLVLSASRVRRYVPPLCHPAFHERVSFCNSAGRVLSSAFAPNGYYMMVVLISHEVTVPSFSYRPMKIYQKCKLTCNYRLIG